MAIKRGRQRITMAKMEKESNLQVTFSKRRTGLFKKSSELTTLCGAEILLIIFSPGKKVFSFGHPSVDELAHRFFGTHGSSSSMGLSIVENYRMSNIKELNVRLMEMEEMLEGEKRRGELLSHALRVRHEQRWWEGPIEEMSNEQLELLKNSMENMKAYAAQMMYKASNSFLVENSSINGGGDSFIGNNDLGAMSFTQYVMGGSALPMAPPHFGGQNSIGDHHPIGWSGYGFIHN